MASVGKPREITVYSGFWVIMGQVSWFKHYLRGFFPHSFLPRVTWTITDLYLIYSRIFNLLPRVSHSTLIWGNGWREVDGLESSAEVDFSTRQLMKCWKEEERTWDDAQISPQLLILSLLSMLKISSTSNSAQEIGLKKCHFPLMIQKLKLPMPSYN